MGTKVGLESKSSSTFPLSTSEPTVGGARLLSASASAAAASSAAASSVWIQRRCVCVVILLLSMVQTYLFVGVVSSSSPATNDVTMATSTSTSTSTSIRTNTNTANIGAEVGKPDVTAVDSINRNNSKKNNGKLLDALKSTVPQVTSSTVKNENPRNTQRPPASSARLNNPTATQTATNKNKNNVFIDPRPPWYQPLRNDHLLSLSNITNLTTSTATATTTATTASVPPIDMDAVVIAATIDATLAICLHNLFHLVGIRRFVIIVNDAQKDCDAIFDLLPQHNNNNNNNNRPPHICLEHFSFYTPTEVAHLKSSYPNIHRGAPQKNKRGNQYVHVSRFGWYLQQFSKYLVSRIVPDLSQQHLTIDGDLIITRPMDFWVDDDSMGEIETANDSAMKTKTKAKAKTKKIIMPQTSKDPTQWRYFGDLILGNQTAAVDSVKNEKKTNYVVGWMVLDRTIVSDLIDTIDAKLQSRTRRSIDGTTTAPTNATFPWNILEYAEEGMDDARWFSEFYLYARFALQHPSDLYVTKHFREPTRNKGKFKYTCLLNKRILASEWAMRNTGDNNDYVKPPWMIWEEHKQHVYDACPDKESSNRLTRLSEIGIWHEFHKPPWGGGNQFLLAVRGGLKSHWNVSVSVKSDPDTVDPKGQGRATLKSAQVLLANSITFKGGSEAMKELKKSDQLALVHRVDGPYYVARYFQPLNFTPPLPHDKVPKEDKKTKTINDDLACATIFQSTWSLKANTKIGLELRNPIVIPNTVDPTLFYSAPRPRRGGRKLKIVATSHSNNVRKGFDTMMWIDRHLDYERFEFWYMGGRPKWFPHGDSDVDYKSRIVIHAGNESHAVADFLRSGDIYLAPSRYEPASNAVSEALACGLPVLYQEGSSHGDLVGDAGVGFESTGPELLARLDSLVENYDRHVQAIDVPSIQDVTRRYLSVMRWCFYMKRLLP